MRPDPDHRPRPPLPGAGFMEDYTRPFLVTAGVLCFVGLFALWAVAGLPFVLICAVIADRLMRR